MATAAWPIPLIASRESRAPTEWMPRHLPCGEDPGVDLQMQMAVGVTGPGGVVPDHRRLDLLHRHLHLPAARPHPRRRVRGDPADDLLGRTLLCRIQGGRDLRVEGGRERPGLRAVDGDLDEPQRVRVVPQPALGLAGLDVVAGHPPLVGLAVEVAGLPHRRAHRVAHIGDVPGRDAGTFGQVVVVGTGVVGLDVGTRGSGRAAVELHPAMHADHPESGLGRSGQRLPATSNNYP